MPMGGFSKTNEASFRGRTIYVSSSGSDSNSGLSAEYPIKTLSVANYKTKSGDRILFKGGNTFAGKLNPQHSNIEYGTYDPVVDFSGTASITNNVMTVISQTPGNTGVIGLGSKITITGLRKTYFSADMPVYVVGLGTGTGGVGTYYINPNLPDGATLLIPESPVSISGKKPQIAGTSSEEALYSDKSNVTINGLCFVNDSCRVFNVTANSELSGLSIKNSAFIQTTAGSSSLKNIGLFYNHSYPLHDIVFEDNLVVGPGYSYVNEQNGVWFDSTNSLYNLSIKRNAFYNIQCYGLNIWSYDKETIASRNAFPVNVSINDNVFSNIAHAAIHSMNGMLGTSTVSRNAVYNSGTVITPNVNAIQSGYWVNTIVEYNDVRNIYTSVPDGIGIIIDFAWTDTNYQSTGCHVRYNYVTGSDSAGISNWQGSNNYIYCNITDHNYYGIAQAIGSSQNNKFYNNVMSYNIGGARITSGGVSPAGPSEWFNNIIINNDFGFSIDGASSLPSEHDNIFYNNSSAVSNGQALSAADLFSDPLLNANYTPTAESPTRKRGVLIDGISSITSINNITSSSPDIGAYFFV